MQTTSIGKGLTGLLLLFGVLPFGSLPCRAQSQTVEQTILFPAATAPGVPRREYLTSGGLINGVHGYVIVLDPAAVGTGFSLQPAASNVGTGNLNIYFYSDFPNGVTCTEAATPSSTESGIVCGTHAIVVILDGANVTFHYESGLPVPPEPPFEQSRFGFGNPVPLLDANGHPRGAGEPSIAVDPAGPTYVVGPEGCNTNDPENQCIAFFRSTDGGATFTQPNPTAFTLDAPLGGGDSEVAVDHLGRVYAADLLTLTSVAVWRSVDHGNIWAPTITAPCVDREWLAPGGPNAPTGPNTLYETNHDCTAGSLHFWRSIDAGATFTNLSVVNSDVSQPGFIIDTASGSVEADLQVDRVTGTVYVLWAAPAIEDGPNQPVRIVLLGRSDDGGTTWRNFLVSAEPPGSSVANLFPVLAVDRSGKLYAAWSSNKAGLYGVFASASTDRGEHWTSPTRVSALDQTAIFPAIAAGGSGKVDLIWLGTSAPSPDDASAQWQVFFAQSKKAFDSPSKWSVGQVTQNVMHLGDICRQGILCLVGGNRNLLDFISVDVDADGMSNIVWTDDASRPDLGKVMMFAKQLSGPGVGRSGPNM